MQKQKILNSREAKKIIEIINKQYGTESKMPDFSFLLKEDKLYIVSKDFRDFELTRIYNIGLYFARVDEGSVRLSIEGSQLIGEHATKNIVVLDKDSIQKWISGFDIETNEKSSDFVLIKYKNDFYGSGKISNGKILNFTPKERRIYNLSSMSTLDN